MKGFDAATDSFEFTDYHAYMAATAPSYKSKKGMDPDYPTLIQALAGPDYQEWWDAMGSEIDVLKKLDSFELAFRREVIAIGYPIIKSAWAL